MVGGRMEILSLDSLIEGQDTGATLLNVPVARAREVGHSKVSVIADKRQRWCTAALSKVRI